MQWPRLRLGTNHRPAQPDVATPLKLAKVVDLLLLLAKALSISFVFSSFRVPVLAGETPLVSKEEEKWKRIGHVFWACWVLCLADQAEMLWHGDNEWLTCVRGL